MAEADEVAHLPPWTEHEFRRNRRMAEVAAHLSDSVVPVVPMRQWVLSVPTPDPTASTRIRSSSGSERVSRDPGLEIDHVLGV